MRPENTHFRRGGALLCAALAATAVTAGQLPAQTAPAPMPVSKAPDEQAVMDRELRQGAASPDTRSLAEEAKLPPLPVRAEILPEKRQAIKDWGAYPAFLRTDWPSGGRHHILDKPDVQQMVYRDLGITLMRTSFFPKSYDEKKDDGTLNTAYLDQTIVAHLQTARKHGIKRYIVSIWSPPPVMKDPPIEEGRDKDGKPSRLRPEREDDYVRYVVSVLDHLKNRGVGAPVAFSVQNELTYPAKWDGCKYEPEQYVRVVKKMRRALDAAGYKETLIFGPESGSYAGNIDYLGGPEMPLMRQDAELRDAVDVIAFHGYSEWSDKDDIPQRMRRWVETAHSLGKEVWMSEYSITDSKLSDIDHAIRVAQRLGRETAYLGVDRWVYWSAWHGHNRNTALIATVNQEETGRFRYRKTQLYHVLARLWNEAPPPAAVRLVRTDDRQICGWDPYTVEAVAFASAGKTVTLLINPTGRARTLTLSGLGQGRQARVYQATPAVPDMPELPPSPLQAGAATVTLPGRSITVVSAGPP